MDVNAESIPIITVIVIIPVLMLLAVNGDISQKEASVYKTDMILQTMLHYAEKGFDEICINDGSFTYCILEQQN